MLDEAPSHAVDAIVQDALAEQRASGVIPKTNEVRAYVQAIVEKMDRKESERRPAPSVETPSPHPHHTSIFSSDGNGEQLEREYRKRLARRGEEPLPGTWRVEHKAPTPKTSKARRILGKAEKLMRQRLKLLRSKPDWADKLKRINPLALQGQLGKTKNLEADAEVRKVINASNIVFGHWAKEPGKRLFFV